jgi:LysR family hydrogen peroxide-inducible transcriptional activator
MERPTLRQLEYFVAVAERLSFRKAAESCFVTQPSLSVQIAQLEALLGVRLFERDRRGVQLTPAGEALVPGAKETLGSCDRFGQLAKSFGAPLTGPLRLGVIPTIGPYLLPKVLPAVSAAYPELQVFLREDTTARLLEQLEAGKLDLLLLAIDIDLGGVTTQPLFSDPFVVAVPADNDLASSDEASLSDLEGSSVLLLDEGHCLRAQALSLCDSAGAGELSGFRASSLGTVTQMVAGGLGITLLPELAVEREAAAVPGLRVVPFGADGPSRSVGLAWRASSPRAEEYRALGETLATAYAQS